MVLCLSFIVIWHYYLCVHSLFSFCCQLFLGWARNLPTVYPDTPRLLLICVRCHRTCAFNWQCNQRTSEYTVSKSWSRSADEMCPACTSRQNSKFKGMLHGQKMETRLCFSEFSHFSQAIDNHRKCASCRQKEERDEVLAEQVRVIREASHYSIASASAGAAPQLTHQDMAMGQLDFSQWE